MANDFGSRAQWFSEVKDLCDNECVDIGTTDIWTDAFEANVLPYDAVKSYLTEIGRLQ